MPRTQSARELLDKAKVDAVLSDAALVEQAARLHDECSTCHGAGGNYHPEQPCPECGLTCFDSVGLEGVGRRRSK